MIPESQADKLLAPIYTQYTDVETTILAHAGDIQLTLLCAKSTQEAAQPAWTSWPARWKRRWTTGSTRREGDSLEQIVLYYLGLRQATLAVAESCTGGLIAERITSVPGSSRSFLGGAVVYSNQLKISFANVRAGPDFTARRGLRRSGQGAGLGNPRSAPARPLGLGVTGVAGPSGGTEAKPVGLVYIAVSDAQKTDVVEHTFRGPRIAYPRVGRYAGARLDSAETYVVGGSSDLDVQPGNREPHNIDRLAFVVSHPFGKRSRKDGARKFRG